MHTKEEILEIASQGMSKGEAKRLRALCSKPFHKGMATSPVYNLPYQVMILYATKLNKE